MNDSSKVWVPNGLPHGLAMVLSVPDPGGPMTYDLYLALLEAKLDELIQEDPKEARRAMEMSREGAPHLWTIAEYSRPKDWAAQIVQSDQMTSLLAPWKGGGSLQNPEPQSLLGILELLA